jgi:hypothetical protein
MILPVHNHLEVLFFARKKASTCASVGSLYAVLGALGACRSSETRFPCTLLTSMLDLGVPLLVVTLDPEVLSGTNDPAAPFRPRVSTWMLSLFVVQSLKEFPIVSFVGKRSP